MYESHRHACDIFSTTVDSYQSRAEAREHNFSSLIFQRRIAIVNDMLAKTPSGARVLDFGMGPAVFGPACVQRGLHYLGIDISSTMVERARSLNLPDAEFHVGDLESLDEFSGQMDVVLAIGLLDYLEHPEDGIRKLAACVKPGGRLVVSFRNRNSVPRLLRDVAKTGVKLLPGKQRSQSGRVFFSDAHERAFDSRSDLEPQLSRVGFGEFLVDYFNCSPLFFNFALPRWAWNTWYRADARIAGRRSQHLCSGGVLCARRVAGETGSEGCAA